MKFKESEIEILRFGLKDVIVTSVIPTDDQGNGNTDDLTNQEHEVQL